MKLTRDGLKEKEAWRAKGYRIPEYDLEKVVKDTKENPYWLHFGAGNIFKAFQANVVQNLLNEGILDRGIIAVGNAESIEKVNRPHDELNILMTLKADGTMEKTVVGSVVESCILDAENVPERLAYYLSEINVLHPFREGNGRTQRLFIEYLALNAGYRVDFSDVTPEEMIIASAESFACDYDKINLMFERITHKI